MSHVKLGDANDTDSQTVIRAQGDFLAPSVFSAAAYTANNSNALVGLEGAGKNGGAGTTGRGGSPRRNAEAPAAGPGVIGRGGPVEDDQPGLPGAGVIGVATGVRDPDPQDSSGVGVYGAGAIGVLGQGTAPSDRERRFGTGVVGLVAEIELPDAKIRAGAGVFGESGVGPGVVGIAGGPLNPEDIGAAGVVGEGGSGPGGEFSSSLGGQVHLTPSNSPSFPTLGRRGDLWVHVGKNSPKGTKFHEGAVSLYVCVEDIPEVRWQKVLLDTPKLKGGTPVP